MAATGELNVAIGCIPLFAAQLFKVEQVVVPISFNRYKKTLPG
jgi:hypothetical protein